MRQPKSDLFVSVIASIHNEAEEIAGFVRELSATLSAEYANYEMIVVDDGSTDATMDVLSSLLAGTAGLRVLQLSRKFGWEAAVLAGMDSSIGDYVVVMLMESDPSVLIPQMVEICRSGSGVVVGVERHPPRRSFGAKLASRFFHWYCRRYLATELYQGSRFFRVFSRAALNAVLQIKDRVRNLRYLSSIIGFRADLFFYDPVWRSGTLAPRRLVDDIATGLNVVLANSRHPLRLVTLLGVLASGVNLLYMLYVVLIYLFKQDVAEGWTTLSMQQGVMFFLVFLILTVLAEYVGLVLWETRGRPVYFLEAEHQATIGPDMAERRNVVREST